MAPLEQAIQNLFNKLEYINSNDAYVIQFDPKILKNRLDALKTGSTRSVEGYGFAVYALQQK